MAIEPIDTVQGIAGKEIAVYDANYDNSQIDQEGFLQILLASFQYQDPFEAEDISKFIDNTVKLQELEVMKNFEDSVQTLNDNNTLFFNSTNLIGTKVMYSGNETYIENGKSSVEFKVKEDAQQATVYIYDDQENIVAQKDFTNLNTLETYEFTIDDSSIADGYYKVSVVASNGDERVDTEVYSTALVSGIQKDGADILALYDRGVIKISDIVEIGG